VGVRTSIYVVPSEQARQSSDGVVRVVRGLCTREITIMPALVVEPLRPDVRDPLGLGEGRIVEPRSPDQGELVDSVAALERRLATSTASGGVEVILQINKPNVRMARDFDLPQLDCQVAIYSLAQAAELVLEHDSFDESVPQVTDLGQPFWYLCFRGVAPPFSWRFHGSWIDHQLLAELGPFRIGELAHF